MKEPLSITGDLSLEPGVHLLPGGITVNADGVTLYGRGALPAGDGFFLAGLAPRRDRRQPGSRRLPYAAKPSGDYTATPYLGRKFL